MNVIENIPKGVLIMFPNYVFLEYCFEMWSKNASKPCFKEFKNKSL